MRKKKSLPPIQNDIKVPICKELPAKRGISGRMATGASLESSYNSISEHKVTPVKLQDPWGTCWSFGAISSLESSMIAQGLSMNGQKCTESNTDLSERHLAYFAYNNHLQQTALM